MGCDKEYEIVTGAVHLKEFHTLIIKELFFGRLGEFFHGVSDIVRCLDKVE